MAFTRNHEWEGNQSPYQPSYSGQLDPYASPVKGLINTPYFRSSQGLEHQSSMLGALSGVPFVGKVASGYQKALNAQIDRQFQEYMARLGFDFSNEQREKQNLYNYWVANEFMDKQNQWNSYANQVAEMRKAGLNPAGIFGEGQLTGNNSSQSAPTGGAPSGSATGLGYQSQTDTGGMSDLADFANVLKSLADAKKSGAETKSIESMLDEQIKDLQLRNDYQQILNTYQGKKSATEIAKMLQDIERQYVEIDNLIKEGNLTEANIKLAEVNRQIAEENKGKAQAEKELAQALADKREEYTNNILKQQKAETKKTLQEGDASERTSKAQVAYFAEQANDLKKTRQARIDNMRADTRQKNALAAINEYELDTRPSKIVASWHNFVNMCVETASTVSSSKYLQSQLDLIGQEIERAKKNNDYYLVGMLMDNAKDFAIALGSFAIAAKTGKEMIGTKARPIGFNK